MDHQLSGVNVTQFRQALSGAADAVLVVQPAALRDPIALWFRSVEAQAAAENWTHLLGCSVVAVWNAAQAILSEGGSDG